MADESTLIIFSSDNGASYDCCDNSPLPGSKYLNIIKIKIN